jgi:hypothetical protein
MGRFRGYWWDTIDAALGPWILTAPDHGELWFAGSPCCQYEEDLSSKTVAELAADHNSLVEQWTELAGLALDAGVSIDDIRALSQGTLFAKRCDARKAALEEG